MAVLALCLCAGAAGGRAAHPRGTLLVESVAGTMALPSNALFTVAPSGSRRRTVVPPGPVDYELPAWSPDATRIAYGRCELEDGCRIGIVDVATRKRRLLAARGSAPSWSPDGRRLAFAAGPTEEAWGTLSIVGLGAARPVRLARRLAIDAPAWSPEGRQIAFVALRGVNDPTPPWLYVIRPDGRGLRRLTAVTRAGDDFSGGRIGDFLPSWSPDGELLAVPSAAGKAVTVVDLRGRVRWRLAGRELVGPVSWSPDGRRIAFGDDGRIYVVGRDGRNVRAVTRRGRYAWQRYAWLYGWGPASRRIVIARDRGLFLVDVATRKERKVAGGRFGDTAWGWRRRG